MPYLTESLILTASVGAESDSGRGLLLCDAVGGRIMETDKTSLHTSETWEWKMSKPRVISQTVSHLL